MTRSRCGSKILKFFSSKNLYILLHSLYLIQCTWLNCSAINWLHEIQNVFKSEITLDLRIDNNQMELHLTTRVDGPTIRTQLPQFYHCQSIYVDWCIVLIEDNDFLLKSRSGLIPVLPNLSRKCGENSQIIVDLFPK